MVMVLDEVPEVSEGTEGNEGMEHHPWVHGLDARRT